MANVNNNVNGQSRKAEVALRNAMRKEAKLNEQMATGMRVNGAGDDPTASAVTQRFVMQSRGSTIAARNTNDGISMVQTASSGVQIAKGLTERLRDLSLQGMNSTLSESERASLSEEMGKLLGDLDRLRNTTRFNGKQVFDNARYEFQTGYERGDRLAVNFKNLAIQDAISRVSGDWSYEGPQGPQTPSSTLGRYLEALSIDPASRFSGAGGADSVWSDRAPAMRSSDLQSIIAAANDGTGPSTQAITINNASFEAQNLGNGKFTDNTLTDWTLGNASGSENIGAYNPQNSSVDESTITGSNVAYIYGDGMSISQTLSENYNAGNSYEFKLDLGDPDSGSEKKGSGNTGSDFTVNLYAGTTVIGTLSGNTGGIDAMQEYTLQPTVQDASLNGQALRLEIVKNGGEELEIDNVRGTVTTPGSSNTGNDATWTLNYNGGSKTYSASGANWSMNDLINQVNADTATTGWRAQLGPVNTTDAFTYNGDSSNTRQLTVSTAQGSANIAVQAGTDLAGLIEKVNAKTNQTGVTAIEDNGKIRFLSEEDSVTIGYSADNQGNSTAAFLGSAAAPSNPNAAFSETYVKQVSFYNTSADNAGYSVTSTAPGGGRIFEKVSLTGQPSGETGNEVVTTAPGIGANSMAQADFTLAVADEFLKELGANLTYYGAFEKSFDTAENIANLTEDKANGAWNAFMRVDEAKLLSEQAETAMRVDTSAAILSQKANSRASVVSMLLSQRNSGANGFFF